MLLGYRLSLFDIHKRPRAQNPVDSMKARNSPNHIWARISTVWFLYMAGVQHFNARFDSDFCEVRSNFSIVYGPLGRDMDS